MYLDNYHKHDNGRIRVFWDDSRVEIKHIMILISEIYAS